MKELRNKNVKSVFGGIGIASLLCLLMVLMSWSAMVTNSDINSESAVVTDSSDVKTEGTETFDAETEPTSFEAESLGFDEDKEMLGMRTTHSKTFMDDEGKLQAVHSFQPLHYENQYGELIDLDTTILSNVDGYYVEDIFTPVQFSDNPMEGVQMRVGNDRIVTGINPTPVTVFQGVTSDISLEGVNFQYNEVTPIRDGIFMPPTETVEIGGNSINYPMSATIDMQYHVSSNELKQDFVINTLSKDLRVTLSDQLELNRETSEHTTGYFGMQETINLPDDVELWSNGYKIDADGEMFITDSSIDIVDSETNQVIAYIVAPYAYDSSQEAEEAKETGAVEKSQEAEEELEPSTKYFLTFDGYTLTITTAVNLDWLLNDYTSFPVVIDPSIGSNNEDAVTPGSFEYCNVAARNCERPTTDGRFYYDYGAHQYSPRFDFSFGQTTTLPIGSVKAVYEINYRHYWTDGSDYGGLLIMEQCDDAQPTASWNLDSIYSPSDCTGSPLAEMVTPPAPVTPQEQTFTDFDKYDECAVSNSVYGVYSSSNPAYQYAITTDMTTCDQGTVDFLDTANTYENGGIFDAGQYKYSVLESYGDGMNGGAGVYFQTRAVGASNTAWVDILSVCDSGCDHGAYTGSNPPDRFFTVPAGEEMRIAYHCPPTAWNCYPGENSAKIIQEVPPPALTAAGASAGGTPTGSEAATTTFSVLSGEEAYFEFTTGPDPGDADDTEIYYRTAGSSGWTNFWDLCSFTPPSTPSCQANTMYTSENSVLIQTPGNYEALVWDTSGAGTGAGSGGAVRIDTAGSQTGVVQASPSVLRLNSLVSSDQIAKVPIYVNTNTPYEVTICGNSVACNSGTMSMFADVYKNGANNGYIEFGLGWPNAPNAYEGSSYYMDARVHFSSFYLIVELEDNTPDATPPTVEFDGHYTDVTSYAEGARTLYLSLMDARNPIDTSSANGPTLWYSTDGGNNYDDVASTSLNSCMSKNVVCHFSATTADLPADTTVDYYWTYSDAAPVDNTKIPAQSPNAGRFPAVGSADLTFTIADVYDATGQKLVTLFEDVSGPDYQTSGSVYSSGYMDRQVTYFAETGEFMFEFDFSNCGASQLSSGWIEDQCFWDADVYSVGDQSLGHWDINWESVSGDCYPGATGCTGAPTNTLELDSAFGGMIDVSRFGSDNLIMSYDSNTNEWKIAALGYDGINNKISTSLNDVVEDSYTPNIVTPVGPTPQRSLLASSQSGVGGYVGILSVNTGDVARIGYYDGGCCNTEQGVTVIDTATSAIYNMGRTYYASWRSWAQVPSQYVTSPCTSSSCSFGYTSSGSISWSDSLSSSVNSNMPNNGVLNAGTYEIYFWDTYGDSTDGNMLYSETIAASAGFGGSSGPYDTNSLVSSGYTAESFIIDLSDASTPSLGTNNGFAGVPFGTGTGEFSTICATTAGHMIFMDSSTVCTPDATESSAGGSWQGFAIGATKTGMDLGNDGMLWQIRDIEPDADADAPEVTGGQIGDSHALDRTITYTIADTRYADSGVDTNPVPGVGPSLTYTVTPADGSPATTATVALIPTGGPIDRSNPSGEVFEEVSPSLDTNFDSLISDSEIRNYCVVNECQWSYDLTGLTRGDTVSYFMTAQDLYPPGANVVTGNTYSFEAANPTNTLVVEWHEYKDASSTSAADACSMQLIMYDVTNEFEFHYDEDDACSVGTKVGATAIRESRTNFMELSAWNEYLGWNGGNPHTNNWRFTLSPTGDYLVEPFDLGMTPLPAGSLTSNNNVVPVSSTNFNNDNRCQSTSEWNQNGAYCAGTFDIPDDFNFEFYGQSYDGSNPDNMIQATGSGFIHFIDDGTTNVDVRIEGDSRGTTSCWPTSGNFRDTFWTTCGGANNILQGELHMIAPYWSRENMDFCGSTGTTPCKGVWYRTLPFDGQGTTVSADITEDTTWYLVDSPIKINPTSPSGYLSVDADLTIEAGVQVIMGENTGISFDGGIQADGTCAQFSTLGTATERVTFDVDRSINPGALWHGLAFTLNCGTTNVEDRHTISSTDFSNTNHAAITAGSRPADTSFQGCGSSTQDCDVGEFTMDDVTFTNVDSAFAHGSGQGTVVTLSNFAVTDSRSSCFNFAQNTVATLTGTAGNPSTMTRCNTNNYDWAGAIASDLTGSTTGSLTMEHVNIEDSKVTLIRTDLQTITISDVTATTPNIGDQWRWNNNGWTWDNTGVSLGLSHGANSEVTVTNFNAPTYAQGWICAASKVSLTNVDLGTGFMPTGQHRFNIDPYCGSVTNVPGSMGVDSVFDGVTAPDMTMYRTFPGTADQISVANDFKVEELGVTGGSTDTIVFDALSVGNAFEISGCGANVEVVSSDPSVMTSSVGRFSSFCNTPSGTSSVKMSDSSISHTDSTDSAIFLEQTSGIFVNVDATSTTASATGPYLYFGGLSSDAFLIDVTLNGNACADTSGKTADCYTSHDSTGFGASIPEIYYGGFANSIAYRLATDSNTGLATQNLEAGVTITASVLDSTGAELFGSKVFHRSTTDANGEATDVAVITGDHTGQTYDTHIVRASGSAGAGQVHPALADGTPATELQFENGLLRPTSLDVATDRYVMGNDLGHQDGVTLKEALEMYASGNTPAGTLTFSWQSADPSSTGSFDPDQDTTTGRVYWKDIAYYDATVLSGTNGYSRVYYGGVGVSDDIDVSGLSTGATIETYDFTFEEYTIGSFADIRLQSPPVTLDNVSFMDCAWMATNETFLNTDPDGDGTYEFKGATMVLADDLLIDGCTVVLEGSHIKFRENTVNNPTLTIGNGGSLVMITDTGTGDLPKIYGESNLDAVDVAIGSGGTLDMQSGTMANFLLSSSKTGQLVVPSGAELKLGGGAYLTSSDLSSSGSTTYPMIDVDGGLVTVSSSAVLDGAANLGVGVELTNGGEIVGDGLTISDMAVGINSVGGSMELDSFTSSGNTKGVVAFGGPKLPTMYSSAVLQGLEQNWSPYAFGGYYGNYISNMDNCWYYARYGCWEWVEYTVDLSSWLGEDDYLQPAFMINYGGTYSYRYSVGGQSLSSWTVPYVTLDNLVIEVTDNSGNSYFIDDSSDAGYYPYGATDPSVTSGALSYLGGQGGAPFWDCNHRARSYNPWRWGEYLNNYYTYSSSPSIGNLYGMTSNGYPDEFGFRISEGTVPEPISVSSYPEFSWGWDDPILGRTGLPSYQISNSGNWHDTPIGETRQSTTGGNYETCNARSPTTRTTIGSNMLLNWPTLDLTDSSIEKIELKFDMMHRYFGSTMQYQFNNARDSVEVLARSGSDPGTFGDYSEAIAGKGIVLTNSAISDANVGVELLGGTLADINGLDVDNPAQYAVKTTGTNSVYLNGLDVDDSGLGANNNYGFYAPSSSAGKQQITNSDFNGLGTAIFLNNDVETSVSDTVISNGNVGFRTGSQSSASYVVDVMSISNVVEGIAIEGTGDISMNDVDIVGSTTDIVISDSSAVSFLDGTVDETKVGFDPGATGKLNRDRSYVVVLDADGIPIADANVVMSSQAAATTSSGTTDATGTTSGLSFSIYDIDSSGLTDYSMYYNTYKVSTVAEIDYSWSDSTTNVGDFRYIQATPSNLDDQPIDSATSTNHDTFSLTDQIDVRICGTDSNYVMVSPCAGTLSASGSRTYNAVNGVSMVEYGDDEGLYDGTSSMDLTGKAIMIDTGTLELRNGVTYTLDNAVVFDTGYTTQYGTGIAQWLSDYPYGTTLKMHGGEVNGLYPKTANGDVVGLVIGGLQGTNENALNLDIDGVVFNNIIGLATGAGDRDSSSFGSLNTYTPSTVEVKNSFIYYYRDLGITPTLFSDADYCMRLGGVDSATISGNTFANCVLSIAFVDEYYDAVSSTTHTVLGSNNVVIDDNTFVDTVGINVMAWADSDTDGLVLSNNEFTCSTCSHVRFQDTSGLTSFNPLIEDNVFNGGAYGVNTDGVERVTITDNEFNNQADFAIRALGGDFDVEGNEINNPGQYAIYADSLDKPMEVSIDTVAGINSGNPVIPGQFINWPGSECTRATRPCESPDIFATNDVGQELNLELIAGSWPGELKVYITAPDGSLTIWDPTTARGDPDGELSTESGITLDQTGLYVFYLQDSYGDGPNGGGFTILQSEAGAWSGAANNNPVEYWDPGVNGLQSTQPGSSSGYSYSTSLYGASGCSKDMDGIIIQNTGTDPVVYEMTGLDTAGDGWEPYGATYHNGAMMFYEAPIGTWTPRTQSGPSWYACNVPGGLGSYIGGINDGAFGLSGPAFTDGSESPVETVTLQAGYEMHFRFWCYRYCGEANLKIQEAAGVDNSWVGPTIKNNDINFDSANNNPLGVGIQLSNCDVTSYSVLTESNTIDIGQNAVVNDGCIWNDKDSVITGSDQSGSVGFDDDNSYGFDVTLDGTTMSGFETSIHKTGGGLLSMTGGASFTAGDNGMGVHTEDIEVTVVDATFDGGTTGTGLMIENSNYAWLYPMDVTGNVGLHIKDSDLLWDGGEVDADTILITETVTGTVQSLTDPANSGGGQPASAMSTTWVDARANSRLTVIDWALDENKVTTDSTSIVDEANWLNIDADHLGSDPAAQVGVTIRSIFTNYTAYSSPTFENSITVDGDLSDWWNGNQLNPSSYASPGAISGGTYLTTSGGSLALAFDPWFGDTTTSDFYVYVDSNDMAGSSTGFNGVHNLPYDADYAIVATSAGVDVYYYNAPNWVLDPGSGIVSDTSANPGEVIEISVPLASLGASSADSINIVATIQDAGTDIITSSAPDNSLNNGLESAYELALNKLDLSAGVMSDEVLIHRSFEFGNPATTPHDYKVMVKTPAEARHTCDYDWATEYSLVMDSTKSLTFDILRACPEITASLDDIIVDEDSGAVDLDLSTFVDDEQDVEDDMEWEVVGSNMDAFANILSDFSDLSEATGTYSITPINDQFGSFDMTFEVVDSHGQTASKTITYTVKNINDAPVICDARTDVNPDCDANGDLHLYSDAAGNRYNSRDEGFTSYSKPLGKLANDTMNSFIRDMANEQDPINQVYTWGASATCDQISVSLQTVAGVSEVVIDENTNWEYGGVCDITLTLSDDGAENEDATPVVVQFAVAPVNDVPVIAQEGVVDSADGSNSFQGVIGTSDYRLDLVEDTTDPNALTFDLSGIKSDIDHLDADLSWTLTDTNTCDSSNYYATQINGDTLEFTLIANATTNAEPWEVDMLNNDGKHQTRTANGRCEMTLTLLDTENPPAYMPNYELLEQQGYAPNNYQQESVSVTLSVEVDNVVENVPDYYLDETEGFDFNGVNNVMPGTYVPVDFSIYAGGDDGDYNYDHLLVVSLHSDGHTEIELPQYFTPPAFGQSLDIDDWEVLITDLTTEVWVEVDVVTCTPNAAGTCTVDVVQNDNPESHNAVSSSQVFGKWSEPGRIGEDANGQQSNRRPAFEDKNWCNNMMSTNGGNEVAWSESTTCQHTEQGYNGAFGEDWQTADVSLPVTVTTIGALSVASFAPSIIAVALTGLFVSALVLAGRRDDDEEEFVEEQISDDDTAVSPVIATILMVAITVVLSGVVYVWAAQLADTDTKGVPRVTFTAENVDTGSVETDHWKITVGQAQTVLATQAVEVTVIYEDANGQIVSETTNLASTDHVYGFSPFNSDKLVTFGDVVTIDEDETISSFSTGDDIYVKTQTADGHKLVDATIRIVYSPGGDNQGAVLKTYTGLTWNQPV